MDFELSEEQRSLRQSIVEFAAARAQRGRRAARQDGDLHARPGRSAPISACSLPVPKEYGGVGADVLTTVIALEALGYACTDNGLVFSLNAQMWACETPIIHFGTEEQKQRYLPGLSDGSLLAAHGKERAGLGLRRLRALDRRRAVRRGLRPHAGTKTFVTNAPEADLYVVFATIDRSLGFAGITGFLVEKGTRGLSAGQPLSKMGLRTSPMSEVILEGCEVGEDAVLGEPGGGMAVFNSSMVWERSCILASAVGAMERQLEQSIVYAQERKQFGKSIGSFQVANPLRGHEDPARDGQGSGFTGSRGCSTRAARRRSTRRS